MAKAAFNNKTLFTSKLELCFRKKLVKCYTWVQALYGVKLGHFRKEIRNTWNVLKCVGEGWRWLVAPIMWEMKLERVKEEKNILQK
jgi:hypothetical protein